MNEKVNKGGKIKLLLIFLDFIFLTSLICGAIGIRKYDSFTKDNEVDIARWVDKEVDKMMDDIFDKFIEYRNDEFIKSKDFTEEIKCKKEKDASKKSDDIECTKESIKSRKEELTKDNPDKLSQEKIAEELKKLDEEEKEQLEKIKKSYQKTDGDYKTEVLNNQLDMARLVEDRIKKISGFKYFIIDNKTGDVNTNSSYGEKNIAQHFDTDGKYAIKLIFQNKGSIGVEEYENGKAVKSSNYRLSKLKQHVRNNDITFYLWVPDKGLEDGYVKELVDLGNANNESKRQYEYASIGLGILVAITSIILWLSRKKIKLDCNIYEKMPQDLLIISLIIISGWYVKKSGAFYLLGMLMGYSFYLLHPVTFILGGGIVGTLLVTYIKFIKEKHVKEIFKGGILSKIDKNFADRNVIIKMSAAFIVIVAEILISRDRYFWFVYLDSIVPLVFIIVDGAIFVLLIRKLMYFNKILNETEKIANGDLSLVLEEKDKGNLSKLAHNINNMKQGLKNALSKEMKSERMKSELITNVSHDLKTPLTSIINYVDLLKKEELTPDKANDYVEILDRKSKRLKSLIEDLFEASKAASGAMELNIEKIEITELMKQTLAELEEKIVAATLDFRVNLGDEKVYVMGDGKRTYRVFENLVQNALKYSMKHSRVYVDLIIEEGTTMLIVKNMSAYEMNFDADEIAERFKRGDSSRRTEGSGLGLAIAKSIMELQGGELKIEIDGDLFKVSVIFKA